MSTSLEVVAFTKNIIINRAEIPVEDYPIEFTGSDNFLIVNSIVPQPLKKTETKTITVFGIKTNDISEITRSTSTNLNIPVNVNYFNYSSVNDEKLNGDITIKSEASISFGSAASISFGEQIDTVTFTLTTQGIADGSTLLWSIQQISGTINASKFTGSVGSTTINNNTGTITIGIRTSNITENSASFTLQISAINGRTSFGDSEGLYYSFFNKKNITKIAFVDGSSASLNPTAHDNYLIYDLVESTGNESINDILKRLDLYQKTAPNFANNDTVWGNPSVLNHTAGTNGYSGLLSASGGTGFRDQAGVLPERFCVMGINRAGDNDIQALCAFSGNLETGKGDSWRRNDPAQTFWSYWGHDFHSNSQTQRIGATRQTSIGVSTGAAWTGSVYMMAFGDSSWEILMRADGRKDVTRNETHFGNPGTSQFETMTATSTEASVEVEGAPTDPTTSPTVAISNTGQITVVPNTPPDNEGSSITFTVTTSDEANGTATTPTVISTTFNRVGQPESTPTLSMFSEKTFYITNSSNKIQLPVYNIEKHISSKEIFIDFDELTFSLTRIVPVNINISVKGQELGFFFDSDGKAIFAVLDDSNDPRAIQVPEFGTGPVQRWF